MSENFVTPLNVHYIYGGRNNCTFTTSSCTLFDENLNDTSSFTLEPDVIYV